MKRIVLTGHVWTFLNYYPTSSSAAVADGQQTKVRSQKKQSFCVVVAVQQMGLIRRCRRETAEVGVHALDFQQIQGGQQIRGFGADAFGARKSWLIGAVAGFYFVSIYSICWPP